MQEIRNWNLLFGSINVCLYKLVLKDLVGANQQLLEADLWFASRTITITNTLKQHTTKQIQSLLFSLWKWREKWLSWWSVKDINGTGLESVLSWTIHQKRARRRNVVTTTQKDDHRKTSRTRTRKSGKEKITTMYTNETSKLLFPNRPRLQFFLKQLKNLKYLKNI